jgi:hypothetical protein
MIHHKVSQGTDAWLNLRAGIPTASCFDKIVTAKKLEVSKTADKYMAFLLAEWILGMPLDTFQDDWMKRGQEMEPEAVKYYALETDTEPEPAGFFTTDDGMSGASPDRIMPSIKRLLEVKCPSPQVHVGYMLAASGGKSLDDDYVAQIQGQLVVCDEYEDLDILSYCPGFPPVIINVKRKETIVDQKTGETYSQKLGSSVREFAAKLVQARVSLKQKFGDFKPVVRRRPDSLGISEADIDAIIAGGQ